MEEGVRSSKSLCSPVKSLSLILAFFLFLPFLLLARMLLLLFGIVFITCYELGLSFMPLTPSNIPLFDSCRRRSVVVVTFLGSEWSNVSVRK